MISIYTAQLIGSLKGENKRLKESLKELNRLINQSITQENRNIASEVRKNKEYYKGKLAILEAIKTYMKINNMEA